MDVHDRETLRKIEQNDVTMKKLCITFNSRVGSDYSRLGASIGENTHLTRLEVHLGNEVTLNVTHTAFFDGLKRNSSIHELILNCRQQSIGCGVIREILKAYQANNNLTALVIGNANASLENEGEHVIATTLRRCTHLQKIGLYNCNIDDEQLFPMVEIVRGHASMEELWLRGNSIGNAGCSILATLLEDQNSNLCTLDLTSIEVDNEGTTILANSLANNAKLRNLYVGQRLAPLPQSVQDVFSRLLCNTSSVNQTYLSNHTLEKMKIPHGMSLTGPHLESLLELNMGHNKSHVAIKKILKYHPSINMAPLFEWNMEGEGERDLKALPYVIAWFERAGEAVSGDEGGEESYNIDERKLTAIYQFAKAMPLMFVPVSHDKGGDNK